VQHRTDEASAQDPGERAYEDASAPAGDVPHPCSEVENDALPPVMTVDELARLLRVNRKTAYDALARGEIPGARRIGRTYRISRDAVLEWLRGQARVSRKRSST
jgi:excisionase family DNA binding protein